MKIKRKWSGQKDLNLRPPGPEPGALARLRYAPTVYAREAQISHANQTRIAQPPSHSAVPANILAAKAREITVRDDSPRTALRRVRGAPFPARMSSLIFPSHESRPDSRPEPPPQFSRARRAQIHLAEPCAPLPSPGLVPTTCAPATSRFQSRRCHPAVATRRNQSSLMFL